jgi:hypothetical protein
MEGLRERWCFSARHFRRHRERNTRHGSEGCIGHHLRLRDIGAPYQLQTVIAPVVVSAHVAPKVHRARIEHQLGAYPHAFNTPTPTPVEMHAGAQWAALPWPHRDEAQRLRLAAP